MASAGVASKTLHALLSPPVPGTFTGVRSGLPWRGAWALRSPFPSTGINSLAAIACNETQAIFPIVVCNRRASNDIYFASYDASGHELTAPVIVTLANAHKCMPGRPSRLLGTAADLLLDKKHVRSDAGDLPVAANFVKLAASIPSSTVPPEPLYLRPPEC